MTKPPCKKRLFLSKDVADQAAEEVAWEADVYFCDECGGYHLRGQAKRRRKIRQKQEARRKAKRKASSRLNPKPEPPKCETCGHKVSCHQTRRGWGGRVRCVKCGCRAGTEAV